MRFLASLSPFSLKTYPNFVQALTWGAPPAAIPLLRYAQDKRNKPEMANNLLMRDLNTFAIGSGIFLGSQVGLNKLFQRAKLFPNPLHRGLASFLPALGAYLVYAGMGAVKFSDYVFDPSKAKASSAETSQNELIKNNTLFLERPKNLQSVSTSQKPLTYRGYPSLASAKSLPKSGRAVDRANYPIHSKNRILEGYTGYSPLEQRPMSFPSLYCY